MKISIQSLSTENGKLIIVPSDDTKHIMYQLIQEFKTAKKSYVAEIDKVKTKRSLNANNYSWLLSDKIAGTLRIDKNDCHFTMLKRYGQKSVISVIKEASHILKSSVEYWESIG